MSAPAIPTLLAAALDVYGGSEAWADVQSLTAAVDLGGPFWRLRGWPDMPARQTVTVDAHTEAITFRPLVEAGHESRFEVGPERLAYGPAGGEPNEVRLDPRASVPLPFDALATTWDPIQVGYFLSTAMWNYLTQPFSLAYAGVESREVEPWREDGETWRRLAVRFPPGNANHNPDQVFYFDDDLLMRRMDYSPYVTGHPPIAHTMDDHRTFDGFVFPTRRSVYRHGTDGVVDRSLAVITDDIVDVTVARR